MIRVAGAALLAYLLGSVPFGFLAGRWLRGIDIREHGSGNPGATNAVRVLGLRVGVGVFLLDALKGFAAAGPLAALVAADSITLLSGRWIEVTGSSPQEVLGLLFGVLAILGHLFPVFLGFRGGKGVATGLGFLVAMVPAAAGLGFAVWVVVLAASRYVSLASCAAAAFVPTWLLFSARGGEARWLLILTSFLVGVLVWARHLSNLVRIVRGEEPRIGPRAAGGSSA